MLEQGLIWSFLTWFVKLVSSLPAQNIPFVTLAYGIFSFEYVSWHCSKFMYRAFASINLESAFPLSRFDPQPVISNSVEPSLYSVSGKANAAGLLNSSNVIRWANSIIAKSVWKPKDLKKGNELRLNWVS